MAGQIKLLLRLQLTNIFGLNVIRHTRDSKKKKSAVMLLCVWALLAVMVLFYVCALSAGLVALGLSRVLPAYLSAITGIIIFFFTMLKTGSVIFHKESYETLCSLPLKKSAVVTSRFIRMYLGNAGLSFLVMLPGMAVYTAMTGGADFFFWLYGIVGTLFLPLLPMTVALVFGALITAASSGMKHKSVISAVLSLIICVGIVIASSQSYRLDLSDTDLFLNLSDMIMPVLSRIYPPAIWLSEAMTGGSHALFALLVTVSSAVFAVAIVIVSANFHRISRSLCSVSARHNYKLGQLKKSSVTASLFRRELKRYFASSIYIMNTIMGPIMGTVLSLAVLFTGTDAVKNILPFDVDIVGIIPTLLAAVFCLMNTTSTSVSLEGKQWWITKSLPIPTKTVIDAKILLNIVLYAPFFLADEVILMLALKPSPIAAVWMIVTPVAAMLFSFALGIRVNLMLPVLDWETETAVVKQSTSAMLGGLGGFAVIIISALPPIFITALPTDAVRLATTLIISAAAFLLYRSSIKFDLTTIE